MFIKQHSILFFSIKDKIPTGLMGYARRSKKSTFQMSSKNETHVPYELWISRVAHEPKPIFLALVTYSLLHIIGLICTYRYYFYSH